MNRLTSILIPAMLGSALLAPAAPASRQREVSRSVHTGRSVSGPGNSVSRPGGQGAHPSGGKASSRRPGVSLGHVSKPSGRPSGGEVSTRPGVRPGHVSGGHKRPQRPGGGRPCHPSGPGVARPGSSVPRPGDVSHVSRPHHDYRRPGYCPPRPGGGCWGAPRPNPYRVAYRVPPVPKYVSVVRTVPSIGTVLGLAFGSFVDAGINYLFNAGYNVSGYRDDAIYLNDVRYLGYLWPEAMVHYDDGLMSGAMFCNWSSLPDRNIYYGLYNQLNASYGAPTELSYSGSGTTATWWGGGNRGYITLSFGYGPSVTGSSNYYTTLTYTAY